MHAPMKAFKLSCLMSRSWNQRKKVRSLNQMKHFISIHFFMNFVSRTQLKFNEKSFFQKDG